MGRQAWERPSTSDCTDLQITCHSYVIVWGEVTCISLKPLMSVKNYMPLEPSGIPVSQVLCSGQVWVDSISRSFLAGQLATEPL